MQIYCQGRLFAADNSMKLDEAGLSQFSKLVVMRQEASRPLLLGGGEEQSRPPPAPQPTLATCRIKPYLMPNFGNIVARLD